jgi:hypothetical protein
MPKQSIDKEKIQTDILTHLKRKGPASAALLCQTFKISQPTLSRLLSPLKDSLLVLGKAQNTQYALQRKIDGVTTPLPLYEILQDRSSRLLGLLYPLEPQGFYFASKVKNLLSAAFPDLPYFLNDLRPSGFLGRLIPLQNKDLDLPQDIRLWTAEHCLKFLSLREWDSIGDLILGEKAFQIYLENCKTPKHGIESKQRASLYPNYANDILAFGEAGSSAAGEQPKFMTTLLPEMKSVLVKFSPPRDTTVGTRIADLLICEHLALQTLKGKSQSVATSTLLIASDRVFLEVERFDRPPSMGRRGLISLGSLDAEFSGTAAKWSKTAGELIKIKTLPASFYPIIRFRELFGELIGNTDMHAANLSFFTEGLQVIDVAPVYDMLPMLFMPSSHQIIHKEFQPPLPLPEDTDLWSSAYSAACEFWNQVLDDPRISTAFKKIAQDCKTKLIDLEKLFFLLPK